MRRPVLALIGILGIVLSAACVPAEQPVTIRFHGRVGSQDFACGQSYPGLGSTATTVRPSDFRLYVSNVRLVDAGGAELPVTLDQDQLWQYQGVALLDFENKVAPCDGTAATNTEVHGRAVAGDYIGVRFTLGVPPALNHGNQATAPSPLNLSGLFWTWQDGYKFLRTEGKAVGGSGTFMVHLGSTGCLPGTDGQTGCRTLNTPEIQLMNFDPKTNRVGIDLAALLSGSNLASDMMCMSGPTESDCALLFHHLGLPFGSTVAGAQSVFQVE